MDDLVVRPPTYNLGIRSLVCETLFGVAGAANLASLPCEARIVFSIYIPNCLACPVVGAPATSLAQ